MKREQVHEYRFVAHYFDVSRRIMAEPVAVLVLPYETIVKIRLLRPQTAGNTIELSAIAQRGNCTVWGDGIGVVTLTETTPGETTALFEVGRGPDWWLATGWLEEHLRFNPSTFSSMAKDGAGAAVAWWWEYLPKWVEDLKLGQPVLHEENREPADERGPKPGTLEKVRRAHQLLKTREKSQREVMKQLHLDSRTYQQYCLQATGEEPIVPGFLLE